MRYTVENEDGGNAKEYLLPNYVPHVVRKSVSRASATEALITIAVYCGKTIILSMWKEVEI